MNIIELEKIFKDNNVTPAELLGYIAYLEQYVGKRFLITGMDNDFLLAMKTSLDAPEET